MIRGKGSCSRILDSKDEYVSLANHTKILRSCGKMNFFLTFTMVSFFGLKSNLHLRLR